MSRASNILKLPRVIIIKVRGYICSFKKNKTELKTEINIQGVSEGTVNNLGGGSMDYSE
jgi:hypothetical protein